MSRGKHPVPLDLPLPQRMDEALGKQDSAYGALRQAILEKRLPAGCRLPSTRTLAHAGGCPGAPWKWFSTACAAKAT